MIYSDRLGYLKFVLCSQIALPATFCIEVDKLDNWGVFKCFSFVVSFNLARTVFTLFSSCCFNFFARARLGPIRWGGADLSRGSVY